jgi:excisionase family DNA binding protein
VAPLLKSSIARWSGGPRNCKPTQRAETALPPARERAQHSAPSNWVVCSLESAPAAFACQHFGWRSYSATRTSYTNKSVGVGNFPLPKETHGMTTNTNLNTILNAFSDLIAANSSERLAPSAREDGKVRQRLFTVEDAAHYLGRTKKAVQHLIASGKLPTVKADRRVFLDRKDLDEWIERGKSQ